MCHGASFKVCKFCDNYFWNFLPHSVLIYLCTRVHNWTKVNYSFVAKYEVRSNSRNKIPNSKSQHGGFNRNSPNPLQPRNLKTYSILLVQISHLTWISNRITSPTLPIKRVPITGPITPDSRLQSRYQMNR